MSSVNDVKLYSKEFQSLFYANFYHTKIEGGIKKGPAFEDLQYYIIGQRILEYMYDNMKRGQIVSMFESLSEDLFDSICKKVLGGSYLTVRDEIYEIIITSIILDINPMTVSQIVSDDRMSSFASSQIYEKLKSLFKDSPYVRLAKGYHSHLDIAKIAILGPILESLFKSGLSNEEILLKLGESYNQANLDYLCELIWDQSSDGTRKMFKTGKL